MVNPDVYEQIALDVARLVQKKQIAYGNSFGRSGEILRIIYPNGISHAHMDQALTIVRVLDKLFRIANEPEAFGESPWADIVGYGLLAEARRMMS
jgi:hypothetical protein